MQKFSPWAPTIFATMFSLIAVLQSVSEDNMRYLMFFGNVPLIFMFVSFYLVQLQKENQEMRARLDALESNPAVEESQNQETALSC